MNATASIHAPSLSPAPNWKRDHDHTPWKLPWPYALLRWPATTAAARSSHAIGGWALHRRERSPPKRSRPESAMTVAVGVPQMAAAAGNQTRRNHSAAT